MKILIVSDTHGDTTNLDKVLAHVGAIDAMIHCGDVEDRYLDFVEYVDCPVYVVRGNCDYFSDLPGEENFRLENYPFFVTHGHTYMVSMNTEYLLEAAKERNAKIVCYGHTHVPEVEMGEIVVVNPGSLTNPRQPGRRPTYAMMQISKEGKIQCEICYVDEL